MHRSPATPGGNFYTYGGLDFSQVAVIKYSIITMGKRGIHPPLSVLGFHTMYVIKTHKKFIITYLESFILFCFLM